MIRHELDESSGILAIRPEGRLESADFEKLAAVVDPYIEKHGGLRGLMVEAVSFPGWSDFGALVSHLKFVRGHHQKVARVAAVSDGDCTVFASGREFLDSLRERRPSCVILDLHMPGLTGLDVQKELARSKSGVPAIIVTGHDEAGQGAECLAQGAADYLRKPLEAATLMAAIEKAVANSPIV